MMTPLDMLQHIKRIQTAYEERAALDAKIEAMWGEFSGDLYRTRKARGITLEKLEEGSGLSKSIISYMENGNRAWNLDRALRVVGALGGVDTKTGAEEEKKTRRARKATTTTSAAVVPPPAPVEVQEDLVGVTTTPAPVAGVLGPDEEPEPPELAQQASD